MRNGLNTLISIEIYRLVKLILTTSVFLSTSLWASPKDNICFIDLKEDSVFSGKHSLLVSENCERNNIFNVYANKSYLNADAVVTSWCRYDRHINIYRVEEIFTVNCILYDNKPRELIE